SRQELWAAASCEPSGEAEIAGSQPEASEAGPDQTVVASPSRAIQPQELCRPLTAANQMLESSRQLSVPTSMAGASVRAWPPISATVATPQRMPRSEQKPSTKAIRVSS